MDKGHEYRMEMRVVLAEGAVPSDALAARIVEAAREITRLRGEVRFQTAADVEKKENRIVDKRKWE